MNKGRWFTYSVTLTRTWWGNSRVDVAQVFCRELDDGSLTQDNCILLTGTPQLLSYYGDHEHVAGDVFNLSNQRKPPFNMPITAITLAGLKARLAERALH
jgi:hypothetical protein